MPTQLPRVSVLVTDEQHALLSELVSLGAARSMGAYIRAMLDQMTPALRVSVPLLRKHVEGQEVALGGLKFSLAPLLKEAEEQLDLLDTVAAAQDVPSGSEGALRHRRRGGRRG